MVQKLQPPKQPLWIFIENLIISNAGIAPRLLYFGCGSRVNGKSKEASIVITTELTPDYEKDYEIIPYKPNEVENQQNIANFMAKYITKPFRYIENTIGVEINFNKVFYMPEKLRSIQKITTDLKKLEEALSDLEKELAI